jgi:hypothetical protein
LGQPEKDLRLVLIAVTLPQEAELLLCCHAFSEHPEIEPVSESVPVLGEKKWTTVHRYRVKLEIIPMLNSRRFKSPSLRCCWDDES